MIYTNTFGADVPGEGNINADPLFVDYAGGDLHLAPESPARGAGQDDDGEATDMGALYDANDGQD